MKLHAYTEYSVDKENAWFQKLLNPRQNKEVPKPEQERFLRDIAARCGYEASVEKARESGRRPPRAFQAPQSYALLAPPGTGKTKSIKLACLYFQEVLGWTSGVEYQCVASQNRMAGRIDGATLHSWGEVPIDRENAKTKDRKRSEKSGGAEMHNKAAILRFLIVDEVSTAALYVLGVMEKHTSVARQGMPFASAADGTAFAWGGVNLVVGGDWLQLPAVCAKSIFRNPFLKDYETVERNILNMFWNLDTEEPIPSNPQHLYELTEQVRSKDLWLNYVLDCDRVGAEPWEVYCFTHGLPTRHVGSWLPNLAVPQCGQESCQSLQAVVWPKMLHEKQGAWNTMQERECDLCKRERSRRCQVLVSTESLEDVARYETFAAAPYVHPFNQPKYHALICHAWQFARSKQKQVLWCLAQDWPLTTEEETLSVEELQRLREKWLLTHDQRTNGIMGVLPLVHDMPLRFTASVCAELKLHKNTAGKLKAVVLDAEQEEMLRNTGDSEIVLTKMPVCLQIEVKVSEDADAFIYDLKPEYVVWSRDGRGNAQVKRRGFRIIPDFAGTAHAYCGDTLERCKGDLLEWHATPTTDAMLRALIIKSRVRQTEDCLLVRPYSPALFRLGAAAGPQLLLDRQRGTIATEADLKGAWKRQVKRDEEGAKNKAVHWPWSMKLPCRGCTDTAEEAGDRTEKLYPLQAYSNPIDGLQKAWSVIAKGQHLMCPKCARQRGILSQDMFCEGCTRLLPVGKFSSELQTAWKADTACRFICLKCEGQQRTHERKYCNGCERTWLISAFDDSELRDDEDAVGQEARCIRCKAQVTVYSKVKLVRTI